MLRVILVCTHGLAVIKNTHLYSQNCPGLADKLHGHSIHKMPFRLKILQISISKTVQPWSQLCNQVPLLVLYLARLFLK